MQEAGFGGQRDPAEDRKRVSRAGADRRGGVPVLGLQVTADPAERKDQDFDKQGGAGVLIIFYF